MPAAADTTLPPPPARGWIGATLLGWLIVAIFALYEMRSAIANRQYADPDDALRIVQVRNWLDGQGWFDLRLHSVNPPDGVLMHWSRLVDAPIAALIVLLRPFAGQAGAEHLAEIIVPLLTLLIAMLLIGRLAARLGGARAAFYAALLFLVAHITLEQFNPMRIDHHGWQIVALLVALNAVLARRARAGAWVVGAALAWGMAISIEVLPYAAIFAGVYGLRWLRDPSRSGELTAMLGALAAASIALFVAAHGTVDLANHCDTVSPVYLAGLALAAVQVWAISRTGPHPPLRLIALFGGAAAIAAAAVVLIAPACRNGPFAALDPLVHQFWYRNVLEGMPVWKQSEPMIAQMIAIPLLGLFAARWLYRRGDAAQRRMIGDYALVLGGALVLGIAVTRASAAAGAIGVIAVGAMIPLLAEWLQTTRSWPRRIIAVAAFVAALMPGVVLFRATVLAAQVWPGNVATPRNTIADPRAGLPSCEIPQSLAWFQQHRGTVFFAPLDISPDILARAPVTLIATGHHRGAAPMRDVIAAFINPPDLARPIVDKYRASYVVSCRDLGEAKVYRRKSPQGLMARLLANRPPAWLQLAYASSEGTLKVWRVAPAAAPAGEPGQNRSMVVSSLRKP